MYIYRYMYIHDHPTPRTGPTLRGGGYPIYYYIYTYKLYISKLFLSKISQLSWQPWVVVLKVPLCSSMGKFLPIQFDIFFQLSSSRIPIVMFKYHRRKCRGHEQNALRDVRTLEPVNIHRGNQCMRCHFNRSIHPIDQRKEGSSAQTGVKFLSFFYETG